MKMKEIAVMVEWLVENKPFEFRQYLKDNFNCFGWALENLNTKNRVNAINDIIKQIFDFGFFVQMEILEELVYA